MRYRQIPSYCLPCLQRLVKQAVTLACGEDREKEELALSWLNEIYRPELPPPVIASHLHRRIKELCRNPDPYKPLKTKEIEIARRMASLLREKYRSTFEDLLLFALLGNAIDFFRPPEEIERAFRDGVKLSLDHRPQIKALLPQARLILLLADNAGEIFFDLPLLEWLAAEGFEAFYVVKPVPIQNDLSLEDIKNLGLELPVPVISSGVEMVGLDLDEAPEDFRRLFFRADLVLAKGMGHFETLSTVSHPGLCFLLCAKCVPVARALGIELHSYAVLKS